MSREDVLLKEYEICQQHINSIASRYWLTVGIFMAINTALLGGAAFSIIAENEPVTIANLKWLVLVLGSGMIYIVMMLMRSLKRINFVIHVHFDRMREIESELGMFKNLRVHGIDHLADDDFDNDIPNEARSNLINYHQHNWWRSWRTSNHYIRPIWYESVRRIYFAIVVMWALFIIMAFIFGT